MIGIQATAKELVERWIDIHRELGIPNDQMEGAMFVYGNEVLTLSFTSFGSPEIKSQQKNVVVFRKMNEIHMTNTCRCCGMEYNSYKEAIECCMDKEE